jgi:hypothetical protein
MPPSNWTAADIPDQTGRVAFAELGVRMVLAVRHVDKGNGSMGAVSSFST